VKAYKSLHRFRGHSSLYTWLYRIALNTYLNYWRKNKLRISYTSIRRWLPT
jgi:RNA polymerase sigma-70 factor (ECF subfamily)